MPSRGPGGSPTTPGPRDGTYSGTITVDIEDIGFVVNQDTCQAPVAITVDGTTSPAITGSTTCQPQGVLAGQQLGIELQGDLGPDPQVSGQVRLTWSATFNPTEPWTGSFTGPDTLEGSFDGSVMQGSAGFGWTATFTATR